MQSSLSNSSNISNQTIENNIAKLINKTIDELKIDSIEFNKTNNLSNNFSSTDSINNKSTIAPTESLIDNINSSISNSTIKDIIEPKINNNSSNNLTFNIDQNTTISNSTILTSTKTNFIEIKAIKNDSKTNLRAKASIII